MMVCPCKCNNACKQINLTAKTCNCIIHTHTHTGPRQSKAVGLAQGSMAAGLTGTQPGWQVVRGSAEVRESLRLSASSVLLLSKRRRWRAQTSTGRGANCHGGTCLLWLIINYRAAGCKASVCRPLHQSNTLVLQRAAVTLDGRCYSLLSALAALW